jgi:hypothetical protein
MIKQRPLSSTVPIASPSLLRKSRIALLATGLPESEADEKAVELAAMVEAALKVAPSPDMLVPEVSRYRKESPSTTQRKLRSRDYGSYLSGSDKRLVTRESVEIDRGACLLMGPRFDHGGKRGRPKRPKKAAGIRQRPRERSCVGSCARAEIPHAPGGSSRRTLTQRTTVMPISLKNTNSVLAYVRYSPQANKMTIAGEDNKPREIPFIGKSFAIDIENGTKGWPLIDQGRRDWKPFPLDNNTPSAPGPNYKLGFSVLVNAPKLLSSPEAFEMCASTSAHLSFCERLYNEVELEFGKGKVPIVQFTAAEAIKIGKGNSRDMKFKIVKSVPRPAAMIEALAKLKAASSNGATANKEHSADTTDDDDFDADDVTAPPKDEPSAKKPKAPQKKAQPEPSSDILDDEIPFA